ncbi:hypothetical protein D3C87_108410 [compost metagenome]
MKTSLTKISLFVFIVILAFSSCKKDEEAETTLALAGNWKISKYDGQALQSPAYGTFAATSTSATAGTSNFVVSFNGTTTSKESNTFVVSDNNTKVTFTKTDGNYTVLSGGGTWTINNVSSSNLKMTSQFGLVLEMTK